MSLVANARNRPVSLRPPPPAVRDILGVAVTGATADAAIALIDERLGRNERVDLAFLNAHGSNLAAGDPAFAGALRRMLVLNDGVGVDIAARLLGGRPFPENLNGTDFVPRFLAGSRHRFRLFLLGGRPGVAERAAADLLARAPQHALAGVRDGYFAPEDVPAIIRTVRASGADVLLVALGNPAQELFLARHAAAAGVRLAAAVGGLFDFAAGEKPRAPAAWRAVRLEWAYRLLLEPGRLWRRYLVGNPLFLARVAAALVAQGLPRRSRDSVGGAPACPNETTAGTESSGAGTERRK